MVELRATDIAAGYGKETVLAGVSIALHCGEFIGLIGPNGCGKSTLLRSLSRALPIRAGSIDLDGRDLAAWSPRERARRLAFVPQSEASHFEFCVRDIVLMGRHPHLDRWRGETVEDSRIANRAMADTDVLHLAERPITELSGGEHRRVLLARALAQRTPLLLLDEPTAHLDIAHQAEVLTLVRHQTRTEGLGALAALHDLNQAAEFCDRLVLMCRGRIVAEGTPEAVLTAENLLAAYGAKSRIGANPVTGRPMLLSVDAPRAVSVEGEAARVHVICGGGTGISTLGALSRSGYRVTAGVLNRLDSDHAAAEALQIEIAVEAPFSPIASEAREACARLMADAEIVVITPAPYGKGNLANLELALEALANGASVAVLGWDCPADLDYADGVAVEMFDRLIAAGAERFSSVEDWLASRSAR